MLWKSSAHKGANDVKDLMASLLGTWKALNDAGFLGLEQAATQLVLRKVVGVQGQPIIDVKTLKPHGHFRRCSFPQRRKLIWLDILEDVQFSFAY
jgi:hypothetical protein